MLTIIPTGKRVATGAMFLGVLTALLPFAVALSPEKAVAAHLIGLVIAAIAGKAIQWPGRGDGLLIANAGALAMAVPIFVWQMPAGSGLTLLLLGAATVALGLRQTFQNAEAPAAGETPD